ncbi:MAG: hypothetical protein ACTSXC_07500 [Candidatus Freyarchaeota archaeon]
MNPGKNRLDRRGQSLENIFMDLGKREENNIAYNDFLMRKRRRL